MFHRIIFLLLIVSTVSCNFNRCADCFQSFSEQRFGHVETQTMRAADCRLQTADCRLCRLCRPCRLCRLSVMFLLVPQFSSENFTIVSYFLSLCALCITIICCTDVYLQGSWVGNEKITGSCLPADVKAVSRAFSCAAFTQERARWRKVSCFFL